MSRRMESVASEETPKKRRMQSVISGADFFDFDVNPIFEGTFIKKVLREKDSAPDGNGRVQKAGSVMGYLFKDDSEFETIIGNSHQVEKALEGAIPGKDYFRFEFKGKGANSLGQSFNKFSIDKAIDEEPETEK